MLHSGYRFSFFLFVFVSCVFAAVDGTMGTPLGGVGTGGVRFSAHQGVFYATERSPMGMEISKKKYYLSQITNSGFQLYTNREGTIKTSERLKAVLKNGRVEDDAIYPIHTVNFGTTNEVGVSLLAFSPMDFDTVDLMSYPYAFFEIQLSNTGNSEVDVAVAMQITTENVPLWVAGKGIKSQQGIERALYASSVNSGIIITSGSDNGFMENGQCNNIITGKTNKVAVKMKLAANSSGSVRFVYSWYNSIDKTRYYYTSKHASAASVAEVGLAHFEKFRSNATQIVNRMRASNIPEWIKDHTLNSLANLTTNSLYTQDGRHAFTEGQWNINGTMDQMWHARFIMTMVVPDLVWKELQWWARTQKTDPVGQIHHDFGVPMSKLVSWDDQQHQDYWTCPDVKQWVDLNAAFIISVYEAFIATNNRSQLDYHWPYVKKAGQRILNQVKEYGNKNFPYTFDNTLNSYDIPGIDPNIYNASITTPAYKIMTILSDVYSDNDLKVKYQNAFDTVIISFKKRYLNNNLPLKRYAEGYLVGQWVSSFLRFGQLYTNQEINYGLGVIENYYKPLEKGLGFTSGTYDEWAPYLISHYGGLSLQMGHYAQWSALQKDWYERTYLNRNLVFNQYLGISPKVTTPQYVATDSSVFNQYISIPVLWRNYYTILGLHRNKVTDEIWLEPMIPPEMNHNLKDGFYFSPEGHGTISASEFGASFENRILEFKPDKPITVSFIYLKDQSSDPNLEVRINGEKKEYARISDGYSKHIKVRFGGTVNQAGIKINVNYGMVDTVPIPGKVEAEKHYMYSGLRIENCTDEGGGQSLGYLTNSSWSQYYVKSDIAVWTTFAVRASSESTGGTIALYVDGNKLATIDIPSTGDWKVWKTFNANKQIELSAGVHQVKLEYSSGINVNWFAFDESTVSISNLKIDVITINIANRIVTIRSPTKSNVNSLIIYHVDGRIAKIVPVDQIKRFALIDNLAKGAYIIKVKGHESITEKFTIE